MPARSALLRPDGTYAPAHELSHGELERVGRGDVKPKLPTASPPEAGAEPLTPRAQLSAAIVIVGDEILSGKVEDVNTRFLCTQLRDLGWQVSRVCQCQCLSWMLGLYCLLDAWTVLVDCCVSAAQHEDAGGWQAAPVGHLGGHGGRSSRVAAGQRPMPPARDDMSATGKHLRSSH